MQDDDRQFDSETSRFHEENDSSTQFKRVNVLAWISIPLVIASVATVVHLGFIVIPLLAAVLSFIAVLKTYFNENEYGGRKNGIICFSLACLFVGFGFSYHVYDQYRLRYYSRTYAEQWMRFWQNREFTKAHEMSLDYMVRPSGMGRNRTQQEIDEARDKELSSELFVGKDSYISAHVETYPHKELMVDDGTGKIEFIKSGRVAIQPGKTSYTEVFRYVSPNPNENPFEVTVVMYRVDYGGEHGVQWQAANMYVSKGKTGKTPIFRQKR